MVSTTDPGELRAAAAGARAALVAVVVNGFFEYPFWNGSLTVVIVLLLALAAGPARSEPQSATGS